MRCEMLSGEKSCFGQASVGEPPLCLPHLVRCLQLHHDVTEQTTVLCVELTALVSGLIEDLSRAPYAHGLHVLSHSTLALLDEHIFGIAPSRSCWERSENLGTAPAALSSSEKGQTPLCLPRLVRCLQLHHDVTEQTTVLCVELTALVSGLIEDLSRAPYAHGLHVLSHSTLALLDEHIFGIAPSRSCWERSENLGTAPAALSSSEKG